MLDAGDGLGACVAYQMSDVRCIGFYGKQGYNYGSVDIPGAIDVAGYFSRGTNSEHEACYVLTTGEVICRASWYPPGESNSISERMPVPLETGLIDIANYNTNDPNNGTLDGEFCGVARSGTVACWRILTNAGTQPRLSEVLTVPGISDATSISAGNGFFCALRSNSKVKCFGANNVGQLGNGTLAETAVPSILAATDVSGLDGVIQVTAGAAHACALLQSGKVKCWGWKSGGQLGDGSPVYVPPAQPPGCAPYVFPGDGKMLCFALVPRGYESAYPVDVLSLDNAIAVAASEQTTCALLADRRVACWGVTFFDGRWTATNVPHPMDGVADVRSISGGRHVSVLLNDGRVLLDQKALYGPSSFFFELANAELTNGSCPGCLVFTNKDGDRSPIPVWR